MSKHNRTPAPLAPEAPVLAPEAPTPTPTPTPTPEAGSFTPVPKVAPATRKGTSTVKHPVAHVWLWCHQDTLGRSAQGAAPSPSPRGALVRLCMDKGAAYYTARTQANLYLRWLAGGGVGDLPRGLTLAWPWPRGNGQV